MSEKLSIHTDKSVIRNTFAMLLRSAFLYGKGEKGKITTIYLMQIYLTCEEKHSIQLLGYLNSKQHFFSHHRFR